MDVVSTVNGTEPVSFGTANSATTRPATTATNSQQATVTASRSGLASLRTLHPLPPSGGRLPDGHPTHRLRLRPAVQGGDRHLPPRSPPPLVHQQGHARRDLVAGAVHGRDHVAVEGDLI